MGALIGYGDVGVWAGNSERNAFLDWFADHRCSPGDPRWEFCKSEANRWNGCGIELSELIPQGEALGLTPEEYSDTAVSYWPHVAQLLSIIETITRGEWRIPGNSKTAVRWCRPV
jgi:hypothetical protein